MGIPELWQLFDKSPTPVCEVRSLADLSAEYFQKHGRPMRIAVDEAGWRFKNLTDKQVEFIRSKEPRANPIEKAIMWRLLRLMKLNIQLIFIFDGPGRPWKHGSTAGRVDYERTRLLIQLLDRLRVPHHRAPAEAEAECAMLQQAGIVDAVWSDDADSLMFGATMLIRDHRPKDAKKNENKKDIRLVDVFDAGRIKSLFGLTQASILLFVLLVGGDYNTAGLVGCGAVAALEAIQYNNGYLVEQLWDTPPRQQSLNAWGSQLRAVLQGTTRRVSVPDGFPRDLHFRNYRFPKVSTFEELHNLNGLRRGWDLPIDEVKLRSFLRERFNIWTKGYLKHVLPALLVKKLMAVEKDRESESSLFDIKILPQRGKAASEDAKACKVTFSPLHISALDLITEPAEFEDWKELKGEKGAAFDPTLPVESEVAEYILIKGLSETVFNDLQTEASRPKPRKRKQTAEDESTQDPTSPPAKIPRKRKSADDITGVVEDQGTAPNVKKRSKKAGKQTDGYGDQLVSPTRGQAARETVKRKSGNEERQTIPARPVFRMPTSWSSLSPSSSQEAIGSTLTPERNPLHRHSTGVAIPDTTPPLSRSHLGHPGVQMASTPLTIVLDDDGDDEELPVLPKLPVFPPPNLENSFGDDFENFFSDDSAGDLLEDLMLLNQLNHFSHLRHVNHAPEPKPAQDGEDPNLAEAIRLSLLESTNAGKHSNSIIQQTIPHEESQLADPLPNPAQTDFVQASLLLDRRAIAEARLAHLEKTRADVPHPLPAGAVSSESASEPGRQPSSRTLEVIDLTLD